MGKGDADIFFFFISKRPSRRRVTGIDQAAYQRSADTSGTDAARKTASVERRHKLKLLKLRQTFCVCHFFCHTQSQCQLFELDPSSSLSQEKSKWGMFDSVSRVLLDSDSDVWLQALFLRASLGTHSFYLFICVFCFLFFFLTATFTLGPCKLPTSPPFPTLRAIRQSRLYSGFLFTLTTPPVIEQLYLNTG